MAKLKCPKCNGSGTLPDRHTIGCRFRKLRLKKGLTLAQMSKRVKVSEGQLCKLENGQKNWRPEHISAYEKALQ